MENQFSVGLYYEALKKGNEGTTNSVVSKQSFESTSQ